MSTSTDTFVAFVDTLSSNLDGHAPGADELAARAYFSRSHFDRIVSAVAGETPARFAMVLLAGLAVFVVGMALHPHGGTPPGERWTLIGGAEE
jgi:AraC family transcriptional regulator